MANMIPSHPKMYAIESKENVIFDALAELDDSFYIFHSFQITMDKKNVMRDSETDFVVFNAEKGILVIEAKAGRVKYDKGKWMYASGVEMKYDGPFNQAKLNKYKIKDFIRKKGNKYNLIDKMSFGHAVCFPSIDRNSINKISLPSDSPKELIISKTDLVDMRSKIEKIYDFYNRKRSNKLDQNESQYLLNNILCPTFDLIPSINIDVDTANYKFNKLLNEQKNILNFLEDQKTAVINGVAGTGKTMIAVEKARRHAEMSQRVLFLCYNKALQEYLSERYNHEYIDFFTIDKFSFDTVGSTGDDLYLLKRYLEDVFDEKRSFKYKHIIVDEGQDFGQQKYNEADIIYLLSIIMEKLEGSFYIFYDKLQLVQGSMLPDYILDADCKLTLYKNCRNTISIAKTSMKLLQKDPNLSPNTIKGKIPKMYFEDSLDKSFDRLKFIVKDLVNKGLKDIVILTPNSSTNSYLNENAYKLKKIDGQGVRWTTIRKFKGLEADSIIMFEINKNTILNDKLMFYVGSSRARLYLDIVLTMSNKDVVEIINNLKIKVRNSKYKKALATYLKSYMNITS